MQCDRFNDRYRIASARRRGWDYDVPGWYFITICTKDRLCSLGEVMEGRVHLYKAGRIVAEEWLRTEQVRLYGRRN